MGPIGTQCSVASDIPAVNHPHIYPPSSITAPTVPALATQQMLTPVPSDHPGDEEEEGFPVEEPSPMFDDGEDEGGDGDEAMNSAEDVEPEGEDLLTEEEAHSPPGH
eukprot:5756056-Amphidinium_carterae.1